MHTANHLNSLCAWIQTGQAGRLPNQNQTSIYTNASHRFYPLPYSSPSSLPSLPLPPSSVTQSTGIPSGSKVQFNRSNFEQGLKSTLTCLLSCYYQDASSRNVRKPFIIMPKPFRKASQTGKPVIQPGRQLGRQLGQAGRLSNNRLVLSMYMRSFESHNPSLLYKFFSFVGIYYRILLTI